MGADVLVDPGTFGESSHHSGGVVAVHPITIVVQEDRSILPVADRQVNGSGGSWMEPLGSTLICLLYE